jgi:hypothetical protein
MYTSDGLEFVNRSDELQRLLEHLRDAEKNPAIVIIRSPSGYGKTGLTDCLSKTASLAGRMFCIVDPTIRGKPDSVLLHDGFFLQRIAESVDRLAKSFVSLPTLAYFLKKRRKQVIATKDPLDVISEYPDLNHIYKVCYDYLSRMFSFGRFSPQKILASDDAEAVAICSAYVEYMVKEYALTLVLREVQHADQHSLQSIFLLCESHPGPDLIVEYTSETYSFKPEHYDLILRLHRKRSDIYVLDLLKLNQNHLEYLIRRNVHEDCHLSSSYYLDWNGNLRSILELKFKVGIGYQLTDEAAIGKSLINLPGLLEEHISRLSATQRVLSAIVLAHIEAIDISVIYSVILKTNPIFSQSEIINNLHLLEKDHGFLMRVNDSYSIRNDSIEEALRKHQSMRGLLALVERNLRGYYSEILKGKDFSKSAFSIAVRQYFRFCARTKDVTGLVDAIEFLSDEIKNAQDQSIYIDIVASAIEADPELYQGDFDDLIDWAIELAYDTGGWDKVLKLASYKNDASAYLNALRACALQEMGGHNEALSLVAFMRQNYNKMEAILAADLIEALIVGCSGDHIKARNILEGILSNKEYQSSALVGYGYRFFEMIADMEECCLKLEASINWFEKYGFLKSKAYSQLSAAMLHARLGDIDNAQLLIKSASKTLFNSVHDRHIILNNRAAVELLSNKPNFLVCVQELSLALRFARDDFSELTILTNLSIAFFGLNKVSEAVSCAEKCQLILDEHDFSDVVIYWPVCFNMSVIYASIGDTERCTFLQQFPFGFGDGKTSAQEYWNFRYGKTEIIPKSCEFLAKKPMHPVYLSHWLIDIEGLTLLK